MKYENLVSIALSLIILSACTSESGNKPKAVMIVNGNQTKLIFDKKAAEKLASAKAEHQNKALWDTLKDCVIVFRTDGKQGIFEGKAGMAYRALPNQDMSKEGNERFRVELGPVDLSKSDGEIAKQFGLEEMVFQDKSP